ncbi:hypothetical protein KPATCC21470_0504 [Kitasatospora purpeofusca]
MLCSAVPGAGRSREDLRAGTGGRGPDRSWPVGRSDPDDRDGPGAFR